MGDGMSWEKRTRWMWVSVGGSGKRAGRGNMRRGRGGTACDGTEKGCHIYEASHQHIHYGKINKINVPSINW